MAKGTSRPSRSNGRPPGRRGRGGTGPGPGYRTSGTGRGTNHKSSMAAPPLPVKALFVGLFLVLPAAVILTLAGYLLHGYGVL